MLYNILALIATFVSIALLKTFINVLPSLMACAIRWKENINIQNSQKLWKDRNLLALSLILPFCLIVYRYDLYCASFLQSMAEELQIFVIIIVFFMFVTFRYVLDFIIRPDSSINTYRAASYTAHTFFILLTILLISIACITSLKDTPTEITQHTMWWISGVIYGMLVLRKMQILLSSYSLFTSFLYLCALEILPTGVLVASAVIY